MNTMTDLPHKPDPSLPGSLDEANQRLEGKPKKEAVAELEYTFRVGYESPEGPIDGVFTSKILTINQRVMLARSRAIWAGGCTWESLAPRDRIMIDALARCQVCLIEKPDWFNDLNQVDEEVVIVVAKEIADHEARYFRRPTEEGQAEAQRPRVQVLPLVGGED